MLIKEGVPPDRIAEALKLTTIRDLHAGAIDEIGEKPQFPTAFPDTLPGRISPNAVT